MRCDCKTAPYLPTSGEVDFAYYVHCDSCGKPWLVEPQSVRDEYGNAPPVLVPPSERMPLFRTSERHDQKVTDDPMRSADFMLDGELRGGHWPERRGWDTHYIASIRLKGRLPETLIERRWSPCGRPRPGLQQPLSDPRVHDACIAHSTGVGLPSRLCLLDGAREMLAHDRGLLFVEISGGEAARSALTVSSLDTDNCLVLAEALLPTADALIEQGITFADALLEKTGVRSDEVISPETAERLVEHVAAATSWVTGHAARVGESIEARLSLAELSDMAGTLRVPWSDGAGKVLGVELQAALPAEELGVLTVWAETKALTSRLRARFEPQLGDHELDDALHVRGALDKAPELLAARELCLRLASEGARIELDGNQLRVHVPAEERDPERLHAVIEDAALLWRHVAMKRGGLETPS
jgi:hypothetical protein